MTFRHPTGATMSFDMPDDFTHLDYKRAVARAWRAWREDFPDYEFGGMPYDALLADDEAAQLVRAASVNGGYHHSTDGTPDRYHGTIIHVQGA